MEEKLEQQASDLIKIVCFGPESTGKTTLARALAAHFNTRWVPEYMRSYFEEKWQGKPGVSVPEDILPIAEGQMHLENKIAQQANQFLFCDTDLLQIKVYSEIYFNGYCPAVVAQKAIENQYHHYFLMAIDIPWEEDNLRDKPQEREMLFARFESELKQFQKPYTVLQGNYDQRVQKALEIIEKLK